MKNLFCHIAFFLVIACSFPLQAQTPQVTLEGSLTLEEAFRLIERQTGAIISYNRSRLDTSRPITLFQANSPLEATLQLLLKHTGFTYRLKRTGQLHILIVPAKPLSQPIPPAAATVKADPLFEPSYNSTVNLFQPLPENNIPVSIPLTIEQNHPLQTSYIHRFSVVRMYTGASVSSIPFRVQFRHPPGSTGVPYQASLYSHAPIQIVPRFTISPAITAHYFNLNRDLYIAPRLQLLWKVVSRHTLALTYGLQVRQSYTCHFKPWQPGMPDQPVHPQLSFTKTHHVAATYQWQPVPHMRIQAGGAFFRPDHTANRYAGHRFMVKLLAGRDWQIKSDGSQLLSTNLRVVWLGGNHRGISAGETSGQELLAGNSEDWQGKVMPNAPVVETGLTLNYRISQQRVTHDFSVKILTTNFVKKNLYPYQVRVEKGEPVREPAVVSNVSYQITF